MSAAALTPWLVLVLTLLLAGVAIAVLRARSLFVMCVGLAAAAALAAAAMLAGGVGDGALALIVFGVAIAPVWLLAAVLLSARAAKPGKRVLAITVLAAAIGGALATGFVAPEFALTERAAHAGASPALWLALIVFGAAIGAAGLVGYGERGAFQPRRGVER
jgi:hypothetical protein